MRTHGLPGMARELGEEDIDQRLIGEPGVHVQPDCEAAGSRAFRYAGDNWYHPDELPMAQLYAIGVDMAYPYNVYGGTHGRGFFITDVSPLQELTTRVQHSDMFLFAVEPKVQWVMPSQPAVSSQNFEGDSEPYGVVISYYLRDAVDSGGEGNDGHQGVRIRILDGSKIINEIEAPGAAGLNRIEWGMTKRRERTEREKARWDRLQEYLAEDEEFFDYYDTVEYFLEQDEEVDKWGRSLRTRVHQGPGLLERDYLYTRVPPGEYVVELTAGGQVLRRSVTILQDHWYDK